MIKNSYSIQEFGQLINRYGYSFDLNQNPNDNGLLDEIIYSSRKEIFIGASQKNGIKIIFQYDGIAEFTLFDPNEKNISLNTMTFNLPINGYFIDNEQDVFHPKSWCLKSYEPYEELKLGFFEYMDIFKYSSDGENVAWLQGRDEFALKCIYCFNLNNISNVLDRVRIIINSDSILTQNNGKDDLSLNNQIARLRNLVTEKEEKIKELELIQTNHAIHVVHQNATNENINNSDLLLISVLLKELQNEIPLKSKKSQSKILQKIEDENNNIKGLSKSRTEKIIAEANKLYKSLKIQ